MALQAPGAAATVVVTAQTAPPAPLEAHPISGFVQVWGWELNPSALLLAAIVLAIAWALWRAQRDQGENTFNVWDLMMDTLPPTQDLPKGGRKASAIKTCFMGAFLLSSWLLYDQAIKLSPLLAQVFTIYMATWGTALIAKVIWDQKGPPQFVLPQSGKQQTLGE